MLEYHDAHPDLKDADRPLPLRAWQAAMRATAAYLAGGSRTLELPKVIAAAGGLAHEIKDTFLMAGS